MKYLSLFPQRSTEHGSALFLTTRAVLLLSAALFTAILSACAGGSAPPVTEPGIRTIDVGYGTATERTATTSTSTLRPAEDKELSRYSSLAEMIEGRMAGVQVVNTPRGTEVLIRGN